MTSLKSFISKVSINVEAGISLPSERNNTDGFEAVGARSQHANTKTAFWDMVMDIHLLGGSPFS